MNGYNVWRIASAVKMHFGNGTYDAFRFHFKAKNLSPNAFQLRPDQHFFTKLGKRLKDDEVDRYAFANVFFADNTWVGNMSDEPYTQYCKRVQTFTYRFKKDLKMFHQMTLDELLNPVNGKPPPIADLYLKGEIMPETIIAFHCITNFLQINKPRITDKLLWPEIENKLIKATPFVGRDIDQSKIKRIILDHFSSVQ
jgi:hypothetical protein